MAANPSSGFSTALCSLEMPLCLPGADKHRNLKFIPRVICYSLGTTASIHLWTRLSLLDAECTCLLTLSPCVSIPHSIPRGTRIAQGLNRHLVRQQPSVIYPNITQVNHGFLHDKICLGRGKKKPLQMLVFLSASSPASCSKLFSDIFTHFKPGGSVPGAVEMLASRFMT